MTQTKGEYRVGKSFNPSGNTLVDQIKDKTAELIDLIEKIPTGDGGQVGSAQWRHHMEVGRLKALAQTEIESGAMWAVKAATKPLPEA